MTTIVELIRACRQSMELHRNKGRVNRTIKLNGIIKMDDVLGSSRHKKPTLKPLAVKCQDAGRDKVKE